jgi:hypothetical protein
MKTSGRTWGRVRLAMAGAAVILQCATGVEAADPKASTTKAEAAPAFIRIDHPQTVRTLRGAINGAYEWLGDPGCQQVFSEFRDLSGKLLSDVLAERGESGQEHLERLFFYDGSRGDVCTGRGAAAMTEPGSHVIFVCPAGFEEIAREPRMARVIVIHELLHTLGLGENPPSGHEITARVQRRCWR